MTGTVQHGGDGSRTPRADNRSPPQTKPTPHNDAHRPAAALCGIPRARIELESWVSAANAAVVEGATSVDNEQVNQAATVSVLGTGVAYETDVFCAMVLQPDMTQVGDPVSVTVMGRRASARRPTHADRRCARRCFGRGRRRRRGLGPPRSAGRRDRCHRGGAGGLTAHRHPRQRTHQSSADRRQGCSDVAERSRAARHVGSGHHHPRRALRTRNGRPPAWS